MGMLSVYIPYEDERKFRELNEECQKQIKADAKKFILEKIDKACQSKR